MPEKAIHENLIRKVCKLKNLIYGVDGQHLPMDEREKLSEIGISPKRWTRILNNKSALSLDEAIQLAQLLGVDINDLILHTPKS